MSASATFGYVYGTGSQLNGRIGNSVITGNASSPVLAGSLMYSGSVAAGANHTVATSQDSSGNAITVAFGANTFAQSGASGGTNVLTPNQIYYAFGGGGLPLYGATKVAAGNNFSGALSGGNVYAWGVATVGRLGNGASSGTQQFAVKVQTSAIGNPVLGNVTDIDFGDASGIALDSSGSAWTWGYNANGQLGVGSTTNQFYASRVKLNATTFVTDALGVSEGESHGAIIRSDSSQNTVWTFGNSANGRLGDGSTSPGNETYPVEVVKADGTPLTGIIQVSAGSSHTLALDSSGNVWAWGYNGNGALGDNSTTNRVYAVKVLNPTASGNLSGIVKISAGGDSTANFSTALASDGTVYTWGVNTNGELGLGTTGGTHNLPAAIPSFNLN